MRTWNSMWDSASIDTLTMCRLEGSTVRPDLAWVIGDATSETRSEAELSFKTAYPIAAWRLHLRCIVSHWAIHPWGLTLDAFNRTLTCYWYRYRLAGDVVIKEEALRVRVERMRLLKSFPARWKHAGSKNGTTFPNTAKKWHPAQTSRMLDIWILMTRKKTNQKFNKETGPCWTR